MLSEPGPPQVVYIMPKLSSNPMKSSENTWKVQEKTGVLGLHLKISENHIKDPKKMFLEDIPIL